MPELYDEEWLLQQQRARPKAFASEFLLVPYLTTESFFDYEEIGKCEVASLVNHSPHTKFEEENTNQMFAGFDVGKKRHPSHLVIFKRDGSIIEQVHQSWLDGWNYSDQIEYLNQIAENFNITRGYIDNTRGELEDRGLNTVWRSIAFSTKSKNNMAQIFEQYVHSGNLKLLSDERQRQQILSVNNELKAPETPMGHGDAFFSIAMALQAAHESSIYQVQSLGNLMDWFTDLDPDEQQKAQDPNADIQKKWAKVLTHGTGMKDKDPVNWDGKLAHERTPEETLDYLQWVQESAPNPDCRESSCNPSYWVTERNLCLVCGHRG